MVQKSVVKTQESAADLGSQWYSSSPSPSPGLKAVEDQGSSCKRDRESEFSFAQPFVLCRLQ